MNPDPTATIWIDRPAMDRSEATYGCEDFRPGRCLKDEILIGSSGQAAGPLRLEVFSSANHLPECSVVALLLFDEIAVEWKDQAVLDLLPPHVAEMLAVQSI